MRHDGLTVRDLVNQKFAEIERGGEKPRRKTIWLTKSR